MFENIGRKIKTLAKVISGIGIALSILSGFILLAFAINNESAIGMISSFLVVVVGSLLSWLGSFFVYGFGELVDCASELAGHSKPSNNQIDSEKQSNSDPFSWR